MYPNARQSVGGVDLERCPSVRLSCGEPDQWPSVLCQIKRGAGVCSTGRRIPVDNTGGGIRVQSNGRRG